MSTLILRPTSDNSIAQSLSSGYDAYALVDEAVLDTGDYCQSTGAYKLNLYEFPAHTTEVGVITSITIYGYIAKFSALMTGKYKMAVKIGSTVYYTSERSAEYGSGELESEVLTKNPATGSAWTWSDIDDLIAGCTLYASSGWTRNYQFYVVVTYSAPPTVTTQACTLVKQTTATLNGTITATEGNVTRRGFVYMLGTSGDPTIGGAGCTDTYEDGSWGVSVFYKNVTGLTGNTDYRVRAYAINPSGTSYGSTVSLKTLGAGFFLLF